MGESLYGKFGITAIVCSIILFMIAFLVSIMLGWLMPEISNNLYGFGFLSVIIAIILGIVGIRRDNLRENAKRVLFVGIIFLIIGISMIIVSNLYL